MKYFLLLSLLFSFNNTTYTSAKLKKLDKALSALEYYGFSGGVMVEKNGKILYQKGFGLADVAKNIRNTKDTRFDLGSVTKHITAAAIMKLEQDKLLNVNDSIGKYIKLKDKKKQKITIQQLLNHTAGLEKDPQYKFQGVFSLKKDIPILLNNTKLKSKPGEKYRYSNLGYCVLGLIIEKVTQRSYQEYIKETFFKKLGMRNTTFYSPKLSQNISFGYESTDFTREKVNPYGYSDIPVWLGGASGIVSTFEDMNKWFNALFGGKVLRPQQFQKYLTPVGVAAKNKFPYANGIRVIAKARKKMIFHDGDTKGHEVKMMYFPKSGYRFMFYINNRDRWRNVIQKLLTDFEAGRSVKALPIPKEQSAMPSFLKNFRTSSYEIKMVNQQPYLIALDQQVLFDLTDLQISEEKAHQLSEQAKVLANAIIDQDTTSFRSFINTKKYNTQKRLQKIRSGFTKAYDSFEVMGTAVWKPGINQTFIKFIQGKEFKILRFVWHPRKSQFLFFGGGKNQLAVRRLIYIGKGTFYAYHPKDQYCRVIIFKKGDISIGKSIKMH